MRAGLLTMPGILAMGTMITRTSPTTRSQFVLSQLLCQPVPPPPPNVDITVPPQSQWNGRTLREELGTLMTSPGCLPCHRELHKVGFLYENFDLMGRLRTTDNGRPIDATGGLDDQSLNGPLDMAMLLAAAPDARRCFVDNWLQFARTEALLKAPAEPGVWDGSVNTANAWAVSKNHNLVEVIVAVATSPLFLAP